MDDLTQWLRAQLDEDERDAKARRGIFPSPTVNDDGSVCLHVRPGGNMAITWYRHPAEGWDDMAKLRNWADTERGWTQERVLREIDTDRELLAEYERVLTAHGAHQREVARLGEQVDTDPIQHAALRREGDYPPAMLHVLDRWAKRKAAVYADRPGYREEWRP